ncbi:unnamed protein product [Amoebophrya sp. A25]|nr:unnamed protein product [Amoebophrya sp. A25]|eukprot:GSA25T00021427001.1
MHANKLYVVTYDVTTKVWKEVGDTDIDIIGHSFTYQHTTITVENEHLDYSHLISIFSRYLLHLMNQLQPRLFNIILHGNRNMMLLSGGGYYARTIIEESSLYSEQHP